MEAFLVIGLLPHLTGVGGQWIVIGVAGVLVAGLGLALGMMILGGSPLVLLPTTLFGVPLLATKIAAWSLALGMIGIGLFGAITGVYNGARETLVGPAIERQEFNYGNIEAPKTVPKGMSGEVKGIKDEPTTQVQQPKETTAPAWGKLGGQPAPEHREKTTATPTATASPETSTPAPMPETSAATTQRPSASETTTTQSASSGGETCTLQGTLVRPWEGSVAPDRPYGVKPCMAKDGSFRLYIPLMDANPMQLYLQGANEGDYDLMYDQLNSQAQTWYTREQWDAAMQKLHTGDNTYEWVGSRITTFPVDPANSGYSWIRENNAKYMQIYQAEILVTYPDGSQETVYRSWIGGYWKQSEKQDGMGIILTLNQVKAIDGALGIHTYVD